MMSDKSGPGDCPPSDYHARELAIALSGGHAGHILPQFKGTPRSILDIGGGSGQTISAIRGWQRACVLDIDPQALQRGAKSDPKISFLCASGEAIPFAHATFDAVVCRVSLPYMHIPTALREISRVLSENGEVWCTLHGWPSIGRRLWKAVRHLDLKDLLFISYVLFNSAALHLAGKQFRFGKHCESIQFRRSIERELKSAGFSHISVLYGHFFVAHARKRSVLGASVVKDKAR